MTPRIGSHCYSIQPERRTIATVAVAVGGFLTAALMVVAVTMWWLIAAAEYAR